VTARDRRESVVDGVSTRVSSVRSGRQLERGNHRSPGVGDPVGWEDWRGDGSVGVRRRQVFSEFLRYDGGRNRSGSALEGVDHGCKTGVEAVDCVGWRGSSSTCVGMITHLSDSLSRGTRTSTDDRRCLSGPSGIADGHACNGTWTSRYGKARSEEVGVGRAAVIARHQRRFVGSHDGFIVLLGVTLDVRHVAVLTRSPLNVVVSVVVHACGDRFDSV
jgi:hypothetical protein